MLSDDKGLMMASWLLSSAGLWFPNADPLSCPMHVPVLKDDPPTPHATDYYGSSVVGSYQRPTLHALLDYCSCPAAQCTTEQGIRNRHFWPHLLYYRRPRLVAVIGLRIHQQDT